MGTIDANPLFETGPNGDYYLSQITAREDYHSIIVPALVTLLLTLAGMVYSA